MRSSHTQAEADGRGIRARPAGCIGLLWLLGLRLEVDILSFAPCLPVEWNEYKIHYRYRETVYHITVRQGSVGRESSLTVDGVVQSTKALRLVDERREHSVVVTIPITPAKAEGSITHDL